MRLRKFVSYIFCQDNQQTVIITSEHTVKLLTRSSSHTSLQKTTTISRPTSPADARDWSDLGGAMPPRVNVSWTGE